MIGYTLDYKTDACPQHGEFSNPANLFSHFYEDLVFLI